MKRRCLFPLMLALSCGGRAATTDDTSPASSAPGGPSSGLAADPNGCPGYQRGAPWPTQGRCSDRSSLSPATGPAKPVLKWKSEKDMNAELWQPPALGGDGTIYTTGTILAADGSTKRAQGFGAAVAIGIDGTLYGSSGSELYAISPDGKLKWMLPVSADSAFAPALGPDGTIYIGTEVFSLTAVTREGVVVWQKKQPSFLSGSIDDAGPAVGPDGTIYWAAGAIYALRPDGSERWRYEGAYGFGQVPTVGPDGTVYAVHTLPKGIEIVALDASGALKWASPDGGASCIAPIALGPDGTAYLSCGASIHAIDTATGAVRWWGTPWGGTGQFSLPSVDAAGTIYVASWGQDGGFYAFNPDGSDKWRYRIDGGTPGGISIGADGTLYGAFDHWVYAFGPDPM